ncbi:MAG: hypothetical protein WA030_03230 [Candidatus Microsaccharimonas sp.]
MTLTAPIPVRHEEQAPQQIEVKFPPITDDEILKGIENYGRELEDPDLDTHSRLGKVSTLAYLHTLANERNLK